MKHLNRFALVTFFIHFFVSGTYAQPNTFQTNSNFYRPVKAHLISLLALLLISGIHTYGFAADINTPYLEHLLHEQLRGKVKGYSIVVGNKDGIQSKVSAGWAQDPSDGNIPMKTYVASGIGSVFKTVSAVALLNIFSRHIHSSKTVQEQLDMPIIFQLPRKWRKEFNGTEIETITYRHLLQHKSGIAKDEAAVNKAKSKGFNYEAGFYHYLNLRFAFHLADVGKNRVYENTNIGLLIWLIPALAYPNEAKAIQDHFDSINDPKEYSQQMAKEYSKLYERYLRNHIFSKVNPTMNPIYKPSNETMYAKSYATFSNTTKVINKDYAVPQGGWMVSGQNFANFVRTFYFTDTFFDPKTRSTLFIDDDRDSRDDRIVFAGVRKDQRFDDDTDYYPSHNGKELYYRAFFTMLPFGHYAIAMVNSAIYNNEQDKNDITNKVLTNALFDAYYKATRGEPIAMWRNGLPEREYQELATELSKHGSAVRWADFYEVDGNVYVNAIFKPYSGLWFARHDLTENEYQKIFDDNWRDGYRPVQVESYKKGGSLKYAIIMEKNNEDYRTHHGLTPEGFREKVALYRNSGFAPVNVSASSIGNNRHYTVSFKKESGSSWDVRGFVKFDELEELVENMEARGMIPTYISAYEFNKNNYCSVIFKRSNKRYAYIFGRGPINYQKDFTKMKNNGYELHAISGYAEGKKHRFAAIWLK